MTAGDQTAFVPHKHSCVPASVHFACVGILNAQSIAQHAESIWPSEETRLIHEPFTGGEEEITSDKLN